MPTCSEPINDCQMSATFCSTLPAFALASTLKLNVRLPIMGDADWFPGSARLVYVAAQNAAPDIQADNLYSYDIGTGASVRLTHLPSDGPDAWVVQEAHVLPDVHRHGARALVKLAHVLMRVRSIIRVGRSRSRQKTYGKQ